MPDLVLYIRVRKNKTTNKDIVEEPQLTASDCQLITNNPNTTDEVSSMEVECSAPHENLSGFTAPIGGHDFGSRNVERNTCVHPGPETGSSHSSKRVWESSWIAKGRKDDLSGPENRLLHFFPGCEEELSSLIAEGFQYDYQMVLERKLKWAAEAIESGDRQMAYKLLREIRNSSNASGYSIQKLAYCFANALEARLSGNWTSMHQKFLTGEISQTDVQKAYEVFYKASSIHKTAHHLSNEIIMDQIKEAKTVHIIDLGIGFGLQWPKLMEHLSKRDGGPPKLRITGIDMPLPGMYPTNQINHAKILLEHFAQIFNVPFEYNGIESKWEDVSIDSLNVVKDEVLIVNCLSHSGYISGDMIAMHGPSDPVLELIRKLNPTAFVHGMAAVSSDAPSFVSCFEEAWEHYSALFDMVDKNIQGDEKDCLLLEIFGREILNIVAYRGPEGVRGPETNKKWETRCSSHGFVQCDVNPDILSKLRTAVKPDYKNDFVINEENKNALLGWKGRNIFTLSVWKPNQ